MKKYYLLTLLVAVCGWLFLANSAQAQLTQEWSYDLSTLGSYAGYGLLLAKPVIVDDSGNSYVISTPGAALTGARITKIMPDSTIAWQFSYPDPGLFIDYFGRSPAGDLFVCGHHDSPSGNEVSVVGMKVNANGTPAWNHILTATEAPYCASPQATVDIEGNLWIGFTETPVDSFCNFMTHSESVVYRLEALSGIPSLVDRIDGGIRQLCFLYRMLADSEGHVNAIIILQDYCCNDACEGCLDSCFAQIPPAYNSGHDIYRRVKYLYRYDISGGLVGSSWLASSDNEFHDADCRAGRNGEFFIFRNHYISPSSQETEVSRYGYWAVTMDGSAGSSDPWITDYAGNVLLTNSNSDEDYRACFLDAVSGSVRWTKPGLSGSYGADREHYIYVSEGTTLHKYDEWGVEQWSHDQGYRMGTFLHADTSASLYYYYYPYLSRYRTEKSIVVRDARRDSLPNTGFDLIKVTNNPPFFDEDTLGTFTTDDKGRLELIPLAADSFTVKLGATTDTVVLGDSLKIAKHVHSVPAVKHQALLGTMYSVHLDNARFAEDGHMYFDTLTAENQDIILNHTELRYNLLVSVEWEATDTYLWNLVYNFSRMSNYLYDVTDGQVRLDTVHIVDNDESSSEADVLIRASNLEWPRAHAGGILRNGIDYLYMPRIWIGDSTRARNHTDAVYPLDLLNPSTDYRTKAHEFGHYALNFFDEYLFWHPDSSLYSPNNDLRCLSPTVFRYGFMDSQYEDGSEMSSEMSGAFRYNMETCRNTNQWLVHNKSCWDHLESWIEAVPWGMDNLFVPILKPDAVDTLERVVTNPAVFFAGPNNDMNNLDYDAGIMVQFPSLPQPQAVGYSNKHVTVHHSTGGGNADVELKNNPGAPDEKVIKQGRTSDASGAWVVGVKDASYQILASKGNSLGTVTELPSFASPRSVTSGWLYGIAESGGSGISRVGNRFVANSAEDSITIELNEVQGYYPLISKATLTADGAICDITATQSFPSEPTLVLWPSYGGSYSQSVSLSGSGYSATVSDSLGVLGSFVLWASDDSSKTFFVPNRYTTTAVNHDQSFLWLFGAEGQSEFKLDSANTSPVRAIILSSPYPVIRTGLDENAVQAGQTHCLSVYPDNPLAGYNQIVIRYDDADLKLGDQYIGDEATLSAYRWADAVTGWVLIGGTVDTAQNTIYAPVTQTGVYAAFTTQIITDVEDKEYGDNLPYRFELSQNYPNPFNPVTTIEYSLPKRGHVTIEVYNVLGQKVQTLVDREQPAGSYTIAWNGTSSSGIAVSAGVYLYRFQAGDHSETKKMVLLK